MKNFSNRFSSRVFPGLLALVVFALWSPHPPKAQTVGTTVNDLTGSWIVTNTLVGGGVPPFLVLNSFTKDGAFIASSQGAAVCCPLMSNPQGVWEKTGPNTFVVAFAGISYNRDASLFGVAKGREDITLSPSSDQFDAKVRVTVIGPDGNVVFSGESAAHGERIKVEPLP